MVDIFRQPLVTNFGETELTFHHAEDMLDFGTGLSCLLKNVARRPDARRATTETCPLDRQESEHHTTKQMAAFQQAGGSLLNFSNMSWISEMILASARRLQSKTLRGEDITQARAEAVPTLPEWATIALALLVAELASIAVQQRRGDVTVMDQRPRI